MSSSYLIYQNRYFNQYQLKAYEKNWMYFYKYYLKIKNTKSKNLHMLHLLYFLSLHYIHSGSCPYHWHSLSSQDIEIDYYHIHQCQQSSHTQTILVYIYSNQNHSTEYYWSHSCMFLSSWPQIYCSGKLKQKIQLA